MNQWHLLAAGIGFFLILEGLVPFFNPGGYRRFLESLLSLPAQTIRKMGLSMMIFGMIILFLVSA